MEANLGLKPDGAAAVCIKPMESSKYEAARAEIDTLLEFRLKSVMGRELPIEKDEAKWYPIWGMPI